MNRVKGAVCLFLVALIFGVAYVFQSLAAQHIGNFTLNGIRFLVAAVIMMPYMFHKDETEFKHLLKPGIFLGLVIFIAPNLQQAAIVHTTVGKTGFITSLYIVFVPVLAFLFQKKKAELRVWISVVMAVIGLYVLCGLSLADLSLSIYDLFLVGTALLFAVQILTMEKYTAIVNPIKLSIMVYTVSGILSMICSLIIEKPQLASIKAATGPLVFLALVSTVIGYTLQAVGQANIEGSIASLIMSLESVFSAVAGLLFLNEHLSGREVIGCVIMFIAVILCQLPSKKD